MTGAPIYVETLVAADLDEVFARSQEPADHTRWDLRFTRIEMLDPISQGPRRFEYAVGPVRGVGVTAARRQDGDDGSATSSLRFSSPDRRSPIASGSGYWRYVPTADGTRFLTRYDYASRRPWRPADPVVRALLGWMTAWSFDRLRLWLEEGQTPEASVRRALAEVVVRCAAVAAAAWATRGPAAPAVVVVVAAASALVPPRRRTPAARRCLRTPGASR